MRRDGTDAVTEAMRRRLELMAEELGLSAAVLDDETRRTDPPDLTEPTESTEPTEPGARVPAELQATGRHLRRRSDPAERVGAWVGDRLPLGLRGRWRLGARELVLVVVVVAIGLVAAAVAVLRSDSRAVTAAMPVATPSGLLVTPSATPSPGSSATATASPSGTVVVDVAGRVRRPGVVTLPAGSRVVDALRRAGGPRPHADLTSLNLAAVLTDGQQVLVGVRGRGGVGPANSAGGAGAAGAAVPGPLVDLNAASQEQLESLPGIGPVTAQKILAWRTAHGAFSSLDELLEVDGIGPKTLAELMPHLTL